MGLDPDKFVEPTDVTVGWVINQLRENCSKFRELEETHGINDFTSTSIPDSGYLTHACKLQVSFNDYPEPYMIFLKAPTVEKFRKLNSKDEIERFIAQMDKGLLLYHNVEIDFYRLIGNEYPHLKLPKLLGFVYSDLDKLKHGRIIMEDIGNKGVMPNFIAGLPLQQCEEVMRHLAKLHAFSLYTDKRSKLLKAFKTVHALSIKDEELGIMERLETINHPFYVKNKKLYEKLFSNHHTQLENVHEIFGIDPVVTHGDTWANNMFFYKNDKGEASNRLMALLDYQAVYLGTGMNDICRFLFVSATEEIIRNEIPHLLRVYYDTFVHDLVLNNKTASYSYEILVQMFWHQAPHEAVFAHMLLTSQALANTEFRDSLMNRLVATFEKLIPRLSQ